MHKRKRNEEEVTNIYPNGIQTKVKATDWGVYVFRSPYGTYSVERCIRNQAQSPTNAYLLPPVNERDRIDRLEANDDPSELNSTPETALPSQEETHASTPKEDKRAPTQQPSEDVYSDASTTPSQSTNSTPPNNQKIDWKTVRSIKCTLFEVIEQATPTQNGKHRKFGNGKLLFQKSDTSPPEVRLSMEFTDETTPAWSLNLTKESPLELNAGRINELPCLIVKNYSMQLSSVQTLSNMYNLIKASVDIVPINATNEANAK